MTEPQQVSSLGLFFVGLVCKLSTFTKQFKHTLAIGIKGDPPCIRDREHSVRALVLDLLLHFDIAGLFQLAHVGGKVAVGQPGAAEQEDEICALDH